MLILTILFLLLATPASAQYTYHDAYAYEADIAVAAIMDKSPAPGFTPNVDPANTYRIIMRVNVPESMDVEDFQTYIRQDFTAKVSDFITKMATCPRITSLPLEPTEDTRFYHNATYIDWFIRSRFYHNTTAGYRAVIIDISCLKP
jgi:hypothetical protein